MAGSTSTVIDNAGLRYHVDLTPEEKASDEYALVQLDLCIRDLVVEKTHALNMYNYYNGHLNKNQYKYYKDRYGIENPTSINFTPIIKKHIDALIGRFLQNEISLKISCKDQKTLEDIAKNKSSLTQAAKINAIDRILHQHIHNIIDPEAVTNFFKTNDIHTASANAEALFDEDFVSDYEIAAHNILTSLIENRYINIYSKLKEMFRDLLITGSCFYRVRIKQKHTMPNLEVLNPLDTFVDQNSASSPYHRDSPRTVVRRWMHRSQVVLEYGHLMTEEQITDLFTIDTAYRNTAYTAVNRAGRGTIDELGAIPLTADGQSVSSDQYLEHGRTDSFAVNMIDVYEAEWMSPNNFEYYDVDAKTGKTVLIKSKRMDLYKGIQIGTQIKINLGLQENAYRTADDPFAVFGTLNGCYYQNRNGLPFSLVNITNHIQDKYNLLQFHRDFLISTSGTKGTYIDFSIIPDWLDDEPTKRVAAWHKLKRTGLALLSYGADSDGPSGGGQIPNTIFNGYDDTLPLTAIQAIELALQSYERTLSSITGVFEEMLNGVEQRDAVANVQVSQKNSAIVTKEFFQVMDEMTGFILEDLLNGCKVVFKDGYHGSINVGNRQKQVFSVLPEHFVFTDFDVRITDSESYYKDLETVKSLSMELIKSQLIDITVALDMATTKSISAAKQQVKRSYEKKKAENDQVKQMNDQMQQMADQMKQMDEQNKKLTAELENIKKQDMAIREKEVNIKAQSVANAKELGKEELEIKRQQLKVEAAELVDDNKLNDEVRNV